MENQTSDNEQMAMNIITEWFENHSEKDKKQYYINGEDMSARDFYEGILSRPELKKDYLSSIVEIGLKIKN